MSKVTTSKAVEVTTETRRTNVCKAQVSNELSRQDLATDYDTNVFNFNWTMRADGKYDKRGDGKLTVEQRKELTVEREELMSALVEVTNGTKEKHEDKVEAKDLKAEFDNIWNHLKSKSKYRAVKSEKDTSTEAEKVEKLVKALYNKSTDPEAISDTSVKADVLTIAKKIGLTLD